MSRTPELKICEYIVKMIRLIGRSNHPFWAYRSKIKEYVNFDF